MGAMNFLLGSVRVELKCRYSERAVNICAKNHVDFWDLTRGEDGAAVMTVGLRGYITLRRVAEETGAFTVRIVRRRGAPFFLWRIRRRYVLLAGMALCLLLIGVSTLFVWQIDVVGNETVASSEILAALREQGVDIGVCVLDIPQRQVANRMLLELPKLSFITLNTHGSRIEVIVREKVPKPDIYDPDVPTAVEAGKTGIIEEMTVLEGWAVKAPGDAVEAGEEIISAYVPVGNGAVVHAAGRVTARTLYEKSAKMPLVKYVKEYTGEKKVKRAVILGGKRINLYFSGGNPYDSCDKITVYERLTLPGGSALPVTLTKVTYEEYRLIRTEFDKDEAERTLESELLYELEREIGDGSVVNREFETSVADGVMTVTLRAECLEEIAVERALTEGELAQLGASGEDASEGK